MTTVVVLIANASNPAAFAVAAQLALSTTTTATTHTNYHIILGAPFAHRARKAVAALLAAIRTPLAVSHVCIDPATPASVRAAARAVAAAVGRVDVVVADGCDLCPATAAAFAPLLCLSPTARLLGLRRCAADESAENVDSAHRAVDAVCGGAASARVGAR